MVDERRRPIPAGGPDERPPVGGRGQRHRPGAEHDQAVGPQLGDQPPEPSAEWRKVRWLGSDDDVRGAGGGEPLPMVLRQRRARVREEPDERRRGGVGRGRQDEDGHGRHPPESSDGDAGTVTRVRAYIGIGANVGDAAATLAAAVHALAALPGARLRGVSRLYATEPVGVLDQPEFRNAVVALDVPAGPDPTTGAVALLVALKGLERAFGRQERARWGPREVDLDLLVFGRHRIETARPPEGRSEDPAKAGLPLTVPHREAQDRLFVLAPLADLAPGLVPPGWAKSVTTAAVRRRRDEGDDAVRPVATWEEAGWRPI